MSMRVALSEKIKKFILALFLYYKVRLSLKEKFIEK